MVYPSIQRSPSFKGTRCLRFFHLIFRSRSFSKRVCLKPAAKASSAIHLWRYLAKHRAHISTHWLRIPARGPDRLPRGASFCRCELQSDVLLLPHWRRQRYRRPRAPFLTQQKDRARSDPPELPMWPGLLPPTVRKIQQNSETTDEWAVTYCQQRRQSELAFDQTTPWLGHQRG